MCACQHVRTSRLHVGLVAAVSKSRPGVTFWHTTPLTTAQLLRPHVPAAPRLAERNPLVVVAAAGERLPTP